MIYTRGSLFLALVFSAVVTFSGIAADTLETIYRAPNRGAYPAKGLYRDTDGSFLVPTTEGGNGFGGVYRVSGTGEITPLATFNGPNGTYPVAGLTKASDGNFYGTTSQGGPRDIGTVYRMTPAGVITTIAKFRGPNGFFPDSELVEGPNGLLYGTTLSGGNGGQGVVFSVSTSGTLKTLAEFNGTNGGRPVGLTLGADGHLYGVTTYGGPNDKGTIFRITSAGVFSSLASFTAATGENPMCPLTVDTDGTLYGVTDGGSGSGGTFFKFTPDSGITKLADFSYYETGVAPRVALTRHAPGVFVGLTSFGGDHQNGTFFQVTSAGVISKLVDLPQSIDGFYASSLIRGSGDTYYAALRAGGAYGAGGLLELTTAGTASSVVSFGAPNGVGFVGELALAPNGDLFGTSQLGGSEDNGVLFRITSSGGVFEKLNDFTFSQLSGRAGSGLILAADGNFYGVTSYFGDSGALFRATPDGTLTKLGNLDSLTGSNPAGVMQASDGAFYGTTREGGTENSGAVFKYTEELGIEILSDLGTTAARTGAGRLIEASDGFFYGVTRYGGSNDLGSVIRVGSNGAVTVIASFNGKNGVFPTGHLLEAEDGNFYGLVTGGGTVNAGGVFRLTPAGKLSLAASFRGVDGAFAEGGLVQGPRGELYGTASFGGKPGFGTVFRFSPKKNKIALVHDFKGGEDGAFPVGSLTVGNDYNLYGTTYSTVFRVKIQNSAPEAKADTFELPVFNVKPLKNDKDADKDPIRIVSVGTPAHGEVVLHEDNTISYLPGETFPGEDTFSYTITDGFSDPVTAQITIRQPLNPLKAGAGAYAGVVFYEEGGVAGYWGIVATKQGLFTGALRLDGKRYSIKGVILNGQFTVTVPRKDGEGTLTITGTVDPGRNIAQGQITDGTQNYRLALHRTFPLFTRDQPTPAAGKYTLLLPPDPSTAGNPLFPQGTGYAIMNVSATGIVTISGKLGDGTAFSAGSLVTRDNTAPVYGEAYKKKGYIAGLITFTPTMGSDASGVELYWVKPETSKGLYPAGFITSPGFLASRYQKPAKKQTALTLSDSPENARLSFEGLGIIKDLTVRVKNVVTIDNPGEDKVKLTINPKNGLFSGKYSTPADGARRAFGGVLFQKTQRGAGTYVTGEASGEVELGVFDE